jgi:beta-glucosidase
VRADDLVSRLTLEEIVPQTKAVYGGHTPAIDRLDIKPYVWISECLHGQVGANTTAFPQSLGLAASFSEKLIFQVASAISEEVRAHWNGNRVQGHYDTFIGLSCFSPVINIMRHPLWGRNQETYGEDPFLSGKLVQNFVRGLQGSDPRYIRASAGCKHFDAHGGPENIPVSRFSFDAKVSMHDWRMTFLPQFKMCVEAGTYSLMCSYNSINGIPACAHEQLLTNITRREWGFHGYVVSDAGAISNIISKHKYLKSDIETVAACIRSGCNMELGSDVYDAQIDALKQGLVTENQLRDNIRPLMYTRLRLGEFDPDDTNPYASISMSVVQSESHRRLAAEAATMSFVLLKNVGNILPLKSLQYNKIAIVGPFANDTNQIFGSYSSNIVSGFTTTVYAGLSKLATTSSLAAGCSNTQCTTYDAVSVQHALEGADVVFLTLGTGPDVETEGKDRDSVDLPGKQFQLLMDTVALAAGNPVVLLLFNGGPLDITWAKLNPKVHAILECFFPGQATGDAIYATLTATGGVNSVPAGRLPATWPSYLSQVPPVTDYNMAGHTYRYFDGEPLYPFGYGLSYSSFLYTSLMVSPPGNMIGGQNFTATVGVLNTGNYDADEVVQVYISWPEQSSIPVPQVQLVAFNRITLHRGEHRVIDLEVAAERVAVWADNGWTYIKGLMTVYAGGQQPNQRTNVGSNVLKVSVSVK